MTYLLGGDGPAIDAEIRQVLITVQIRLTFRHTLVFGVPLATESELSCYYDMAEVRYDVEDQGVKEFVGAEPRGSFQEVVLGVAMPGLYEVVSMNALKRGVAEAKSPLIHVLSPLRSNVGDVAGLTVGPSLDEGGVRLFGSF